LNKSEIKELKKEIKTIYKNRNPFLAKDEKTRNSYKVKSKNLLILSYVTLANLVILNVYRIYKYNEYSFIAGGVIIFSLIFIMSRISKLYSQVKPEEAKLDEWIWLMENRVTKIYIFSLPFVVAIPEGVN